MGAIVPAASASAKLGYRDSCGESRTILRTNEQVMQKARDLFPTKTALHLVEITGYSPRAVEYWLSGRSRLPADALASLLHSDRGRNFLSAVMDHATPAWWMRALAYFGLADAAELQAKARRKIKAILDADEDLDTRISEGEAAAIHRSAGSAGKVGPLAKGAKR